MVSGDVQQCYTAKERRLQQHTSAQLHAGEKVTLQKLVWIDWRDDRQAVLDEWGCLSLRQRNISAAELRPTSCSINRKLASMVAETSYHGKWRRSARSASVRLCYALSSAHHDAYDERSSIAAKGLTGEGYKNAFSGMKYFVTVSSFSDPTVARSLLRYRWHNCQARRRKRDAAAGRALFPWESAQRRRDAGICRH
ncbi:hypothetical protein OHD50_03215 [Escherichia coli]|nr:hypothetical protein [Escherichia coli]